MPLVNDKLFHHSSDTKCPGPRTARASSLGWVEGNFGTSGGAIAKARPPFGPAHPGQTTVPHPMGRRLLPVPTTLANSLLAFNLRHGSPFCSKAQRDLKLSQRPPAWHFSKGPKHRKELMPSTHGGEVLVAALLPLELAVEHHILQVMAHAVQELPHAELLGPVLEVGLRCSASSTVGRPGSGICRLTSSSHAPGVVQVIGGEPGETEAVEIAEGRPGRPDLGHHPSTLVTC